MIKEVIFAIDWGCNSRCVTCDLWKSNTTDGELLSLEEIDNIFKSKCLRKIKSVYLTGGEPFIKRDFVEIVGTIKRDIPKVRISGATNGLTPKLIYEKTRIIQQRYGLDLGMTLSLNGGKEVHDYSRGIEGSFDKVSETYDLLRSLGITPSFIFTIFPFNVKYIPWVKRFAEEKTTTVQFGFARYLFNYGGNSSKPDIFEEDTFEYSSDSIKEVIYELKKIDEDEIISMLPLIRSIQSYLGEQIFPFKCKVLSRMLAIDPYGNVYPCAGFYDSLKMGNLRQNSLDEIMKSKCAREVEEIIKQNKCQPCDVSCNIVYSLGCQLRYGWASSTSRFKILVGGFIVSKSKYKFMKRVLVELRSRLSHKRRGKNEC
jgi:radical SAM protein with 4Fe4S-binding SPASM domain